MMGGDLALATDALALVQWAFLAYFALLAAVMVLLNLVAFGNARRAALASESQEAGQRASGLEPPISILLPAHDQQDTIAAAVGALMQLVYSEYEVIVVNDGSQDATCARLIEAFDLQATPYSLPGSLQTQRIRGVYTSRRYPNLRLIDKEHGGNADALNAGINAARYPLFCAVDADAVLDRESLKRVARPFAEDPRVIAAGGTVRFSHDERGQAPAPGALPGGVLARIRVVEYLRTFLFGRMGWNAGNAVLVLAGGFCLLRRTAVIEAGGYRHDTSAEDMELVMRLHRLYRQAHVPYRIVFVPDAVGATARPVSLRTLRAQRLRWQQGLLEGLWLNRGLLLHPRGGAAGWLAFPAALLFDALGPVIEAGFYLLFALAWWAGLQSGATTLTLFLLPIGVYLLLSAHALLLEELSYRAYPAPRQLLTLLGAALLENFGYRHLTLWWRLQATVRWLFHTRPPAAPKPNAEGAVQVE